MVGFCHGGNRPASQYKHIFLLCVTCQYILCCVWWYWTKDITWPWPWPWPWPWYVDSRYITVYFSPVYFYTPTQNQSVPRDLWPHQQITFHNLSCCCCPLANIWQMRPKIPFLCKVCTIEQLCTIVYNWTNDLQELCRSVLSQQDAKYVTSSKISPESPISVAREQCGRWRKELSEERKTDLCRIY